MYVCKDCGGPVDITETTAANDRRLTLPRWRVYCAACDNERGVETLPAPVSNGRFPV